MRTNIVLSCRLSRFCTIVWAVLTDELQLQFTSDFYFCVFGCSPYFHYDVSWDVYVCVLLLTRSINAHLLIIYLQAKSAYCLMTFRHQVPSLLQIWKRSQTWDWTRNVAISAYTLRLQTNNQHKVYLSTNETFHGIISDFIFIVANKYRQCISMNDDEWTVRAVWSNWTQHRYWPISRGS